MSVNLLLLFIVSSTSMAISVPLGNKSIPSAICQRIHRVVGKESEGVTRLQAEELIAKFRTDARHGRLSLPKGRKLQFSFAEAAPIKNKE